MKRLTALAKKKGLVQSKNQKQRQVLLGSALLPMAVMLMVWVFMGIFPFGSKTHMAVDFSQQYIGFYGFMKHTILKGDWAGLFYSFSKSIGGSMNGVWAYYLNSPFNIFYLLFPLAQFKWAVFLTILLRYGAMGWSFAFLLIKRYRALDYPIWLVPLMSATYALSGMIVSYQMNPIFYDAMIMLPLIIWALEELLDGAKPFFYLTLLAITVFLQFYMAYMICLFIALYACYYLAPRLETSAPLKERLWAFFKPLLKVLGYSILAVLTVFFLIYPVFLNLLASKGAYEAPLTFSWSFQINPLDILAKLMIGGFDNASGWSAGPNLPNVFVGALALVSFLFYFKYAKVQLSRKWGAALISLIFFLSMTNEFISKIWHMGQNPAGFFYRFTWIFSFFMVLLAYQTLRESFKISLKDWLIGLVGASFAILYVNSQTYTFIAKKQPEVLTQFVKENSLLVLLLLGLVFFLSTYASLWKKRLSMVQKVSLIVLQLVLVFAIFKALLAGILFAQTTLTFITWVVALTVLFCQRKSKTLVVLLSVMTICELGYNAYLSQVTLGYADADKFTSATLQMNQLARKIENYQEKRKDPFYRVAAGSVYAKNDPLIASYPGLSNFSSNLERTTVNLFSAMGDVGGNASTFYANGTLLTDAFYGVKYAIVPKPFTDADVTANPKQHFFTPNTHRSDLSATYHKIADTDRFSIYENPNVFSAAFGTNSLTRNIKFGMNNPVSNQNAILRYMSGVDKRYFEYVGIPKIELENMQEVQENGRRLFKRIDKKAVGTIRLIFTPQTDMTYYFQAPIALRKSMGNMNITLNNQWYRYTQSFDQVQLWNLTDRTPGQQMTLQFQTSQEDVIDMTNMGLVRADQKAIQEVLDQRRQQMMTVTKWTNTRINGHVTISDDSSVMMTSIPYNPGWTVKVDGKKVATTEAWQSLLSFPITKGKHQIEMTFLPQGFWVGIGVSALAISLVLYLKWRDVYYRVSGLDN